MSRCNFIIFSSIFTKCFEVNGIYRLSVLKYPEHNWVETGKVRNSNNLIIFEILSIVFSFLKFFCKENQDFPVRMCPVLMIQYFRLFKSNTVHHTATIKKSEWQEHIGDNHNPDNVDGELLKNSLHICSPREEKLENWLSKLYIVFTWLINCKGHLSIL